MNGLRLSASKVVPRRKVSGVADAAGVGEPLAPRSAGVGLLLAAMAALMPHTSPAVASSADKTMVARRRRPLRSVAWLMRPPLPMDTGAPPPRRRARSCLL